MKQQLLSALVFSLVITLVLEIIFFYLAGKKNKRDLLLLSLVNVLTNPPVVFFYWLAVLYTDLNSAIVKIVLEFLAIAVEGYYYKSCGEEFKRPFAFSWAANTFSFSLGIVIQLFFKN